MNNAVAEELAVLMSDISESAFFAGWMSGLEFELWKAVVDGPRRYGQMFIDQALVDRLKALSDQCGGWIAWDGECESFVALNDWSEIYITKVGKMHD